MEDAKDIWNVEKELLDILFKYDVDILNIDRINEDLKTFENYSLVKKNLILNRDDLYGVSPERETVEGQVASYYTNAQTLLYEK